MNKKYIPEITLKEINRLANKWIRNSDRVISLSAPEKQDVRVPNREVLMEIIQSVEKKNIEPYVDTVTDRPLVDYIPVPGTVIQERVIEEIGVTEWTLQNGVRVILKPTTFKNDEILFTSFSPGGNSVISDEDYIPAVTAASVVGEGGVGSFTFIELNKQLAGKVISVSPWIDELFEGISGSASPKDAETMFQLIDLYFTSPRADSTAFKSLTSRYKGFVENRSAQPESAFEDTIEVTMARYHPRSRPWSQEMVEKMDLETSFNFYRNRFADAGDFTFFFVGAFDLSTIKPLIETYLGGLPSMNRRESWRDVGKEYPTGVIIKKVIKGLEPKSLVDIIYTGSFEWTRENRYRIDSMASVLRIKLREMLREEMGGTYGVSVALSLSHYPREEYEISVSFGCSPERVEGLVGAIFSQIDSLKINGTTELYLNKVKEMQRRERETDLKENSFWLEILQYYYLHAEDPRSILEYDAMVEKLSLEDIRNAAAQYFNKDNYVEVLLYPEGS
ncbi:MAG TPA: insulinase family protein [Anaerolineae bacterium]|nr:insulinase family protein [Anaerolineae bacterium]